ncbi:MAG TPA: hypothetical protein VHC19_19520, partial [Pirellulales bacterium]|nr:hypothetical protein [Pirellulales bacterium]
RQSFRSRAGDRLLAGLKLRHASLQRSDYASVPADHLALAIALFGPAGRSMNCATPWAFRPSKAAAGAVAAVDAAVEGAAAAVGAAAAGAANSQECRARDRGSAPSFVR